MILSLEQYANRVAEIEKSCARIKTALKSGDLKHVQTDLGIIKSYANAMLDVIGFNIAEKVKRGEL